MTVRTRAQLQTLADAIRNETVDELNTAERVGGFLRDLADSCMLPLESANIEFLRVNEVSQASYTGTSQQVVRTFTEAEWPGFLGTRESRRVRIAGYATTTSGNATFSLYHPETGNGKSVTIALTTGQEFIVEFSASYNNDIGVVHTNLVAICGATVATDSAPATMLGLGNWQFPAEVRVQLAQASTVAFINKIQLWQTSN